MAKHRMHGSREVLHADRSRRVRREDTGKCGVEGQVEVAGWKGGSGGRGLVAWDVIW